MTTESQKYELLQDLLLKRASTGLNKQEVEILQRLLAELPDTDKDEYEWLAASIDVALTEPKAAKMPDYLKQSIIEQGETTLFTPDLVSSEMVVELPAKKQRRKWQWRWSSNTLWALAVAASLQLAVIGWLPRNTSVPEIIEPTLSESRTALIDSVEDAVLIAWSQTDDPLSKSVTGDVVWSNQAQEGYMRFQGLPVNDPTLNQYQLWIFDEKREKHPVDGGVFDAVNGELIIPIQEKLPVYSPTLFAVTLEQPGGVVVSDKEHIVAMAKFGAS